MSPDEATPKPKLGPLTIEPDDWKILVRHVKAFCDAEHFLSSLKGGHTNRLFYDLMFTVVQVVEEGTVVNRIFFLPMWQRTGNESAIAQFASIFSNVVAFGIVKGDSIVGKIHSDPSVLEDDKAARKLLYSLEPDTEDVKTSIMLDKTLSDRKLGKSLYYIIMNGRFEYEVYRTPLENLYGILTPVKEEEFEREKKPEVPVPASEAPEINYDDFADVKGDYECGCGAAFTNLADSMRHLHQNRTHSLVKQDPIFD